jgi:hypothetical protein
MRPKSLELIILFGLLPLVLLITRLNGIRVPPLPLLWIGAVACVVLMRRHKKRDAEVSTHSEECRMKATRSDLIEAFLLVSLCSGLLFILYPLITTSPMFEFPRERPIVWLVVLCLYPILSVVPQGIIFRRWFALRYTTLLGSGGTMIVIGALCFGCSHILLGNVVAPVITAIGGALFMRTYLKSGSGWLADLEHAVLGNVAFTIGYGQWLYSGATG